MPSAVPVPPSAETLRRTLGEFQIAVDDEQVSQIQQYMSMLLTWNEKVNLTAIRDPLEILYRHFCESMYAVAAAPLKGGRLADLGSGGGFPGVPLKILCPELQLFLVDSNVKKATFLAEVVRALGLKNTSVLVGRYQELEEELFPLDVVCSRALGEFAAFLKWAGSERIAASQAILWVGGHDLDEIRRISGWKWREPILVPKSLRRFLLVGARQPEKPSSLPSA
jgi:16S rRNA (guanine527-N7)-methyltransferase